MIYPDGMDITTKLSCLEKALDHLAAHDECCTLCPRECRVNRTKGEKGFCEAGIQATLSHTLLHLGEEPVLSGYSDCRNSHRGEPCCGSGTIFFTGCHLKCLFCQNYQLSWQGKGHTVSEDELAAAMLTLQEKGALNINFVSPTHQLLPLLKALKIAYTKGLHLPVVYNSNGYEKRNIIQGLNGIVDIFLPDFKYYSEEVAKKFSGVDDYALYAKQAVQEMVNQRPDLITDDQEIAREGVIIRHLVLPGQIEDSKAVLRWLEQNIDAAFGLSLMSQYQPCFKAPQELQRRLTEKEYNTVLAKAREIGSAALFFQPLPSKPGVFLVPDFDRDDPFNWHD